MQMDVDIEFGQHVSEMFLGGRMLKTGSGYSSDSSAFSIADSASAKAVHSTFLIVRVQSSTELLFSNGSCAWDAILVDATDDQL